MDVLSAADALLQAIRDGQSLQPFLAADFVGDVAAIVPPGPVGLGEPLVRRNLVLVSWSAATGSGTWAISLDRQGRVIEWSRLG